ncbi:MAG: serine/threonine-protein kinase [Planctomycetota bacterium]|jgi:serine/threonine-protein kinase
MASTPEIARAPGSGGLPGPAGPTTGFQRELDAYLRRRLRIAAAVMAVGGTLLFGVLSLTHLIHRPPGAPLVSGMAWADLGAVLLAGVLLVLLRRPLGSRALVWMDAALLGLVIAACLLVYAAGHDTGSRLLVPLLGLLLVARAVFVPSRPVRTFLLSLPAMPGVLLMQLSFGKAYAMGLGAYPDPVFRTLVLWDQVYLALCIGLAVIASRVNFTLRRKAYEARRVDRYLLEEKIGEGAMGEVYRARHALLRRPTAVKIVRPELVGERSLERFEREVRATSRLSHPNTIAIYDYGHTPDGLFYYAMELLDGDDLDHIVHASGPMPPARVIHVLTQACAALAEAHAKGLVHRDVKASNLILCRQGLDLDRLKVMDFGLVKEIDGDTKTLTGEGEVCGSPHTVSPEALRGDPIGPPADLYALGAVGCYLLTGKAIFDARTVPVFLASHLRIDPISPSERGVEAPSDLEAVLLACLRKQPADRPDSAETLRRSLAACEDAGGWTPEDAAAWWTDYRARPDPVVRP